MDQPKLIGISELFSKTSEIIKRRKNVLFTIALIPVAIQIVVAIIGSISSALGVIIAIPAAIALILVGIFSYIALIQTVANEAQNDWRAAYAASKERAFSYVWTSVISGVLVLIGLILLIIPGIYLAIMYSLGAFFVILENKQGMDALRASKALVSKATLAFVGRMLVFGLVAWIAMLVAGALGAIVKFGPVPEILAGLVQMVVTVYGVVYAYLVYQSLKSLPQAPVVNPVQPSKPM